MTRLILFVHIVAGSTSLLSMFIPMVTRKGGRAHRRFGWVFVIGMATVSFTALLLSVIRLLNDPSPRGQFAGAFLAFISILTGAGVSAGVRVLRSKARTTTHRNVWDVGIAALLTLCSVAAGVYGVLAAQPLFAGFAVIGLLTGGGQLRYWLRPPTHPRHWWFEHMGAMFGACIAATTAFLVVNADSLGGSTFSLAIWLGPTLVGLPVSIVWTRYYQRKFQVLTAKAL